MSRITVLVPGSKASRTPASAAASAAASANVAGEAGKTHTAPAAGTGSGKVPGCADLIGDES